MKWTVRLLALASTTVCGIVFLHDIATLLLRYNYAHHRFPPYVVHYIPETIWFGLGFLCSGILYFYLVRRMRPISS
jgi:hypothetical protein